MSQGRVAVTLCVWIGRTIGNRYAAQVIPHLLTIERTPLGGHNHSVVDTTTPWLTTNCVGGIFREPGVVGFFSSPVRLLRVPDGASFAVRHS